MTEEKEAPKKEEKAEKKEEAKKPEAEKKAEATPGSAEKHKKVSKMTIAEVEKALKETQTKMGGFHSRYSLHLLLRKKELAGK